MLPKIAVIGAGLAGLTAAYRLTKAGYEVDLYDAKSRIGGRVFSVMLNGYVGELGAQNILDGGEAQNIKRLIGELGLETEESQIPFHTETFIDGAMVDPRSYLLAKKISQNGLSQQLDAIAKKSKNMRDVLDHLFADEPVLYNYFSLMLSGYEGGAPDLLSVYYIKTLYYMLMGGLSASHQCADREHPMLEQLVIKGGNARLASAISRHFPVHLNHALQAIEKGATDGYRLQFSNARELTVDIVILAIPCPAYKTIDIAPNVIPEKRVKAIKEIGYGTNTKILAGIKEPPATAGAISTSRLVAFMHPNRHVLNMYYREKAATFTKETIQKTFAEDQTFIEQHFELTNKAPTVYAKDELFTCYEGPVGYNFILDPHFGGSYSYIRQGLEAAFCSLEEYLGEPVKSLFRPIDNTLFFAGEHTSTLIEVGGTMEAAVESGEKSARLIKRLSCV